MDGKLYCKFVKLRPNTAILIKRIVVSFVLLIILTACSAENNSVFADNTCLAPCWYDIYPGLTTDEQSLDLLTSNNKFEVPKEKIVYSEDGEEITQLRFNYKYNSTFFGEIKYDQGIVKVISLHADNWRFENLISFFGQPSFYFSNFQWYESTYRTVFLLYPDEGTIIIALPNDFNSQNDNSILSESTRVDNVVFFSKNEFSNSSISYFLGDYGGEFVNKLKDNVHSWTGVGELQTIKFP